MATGGEAGFDGADFANTNTALSASGVERAAELGKFMVMDILVNHDVRHRVFAIPATSSTEENTSTPPLLQINTDHGRLMLTSSLAAPLDRAKLDAYVTQSTQPLAPPPAEEFDGFESVDKPQRPQSLYGFGSGDEEEDPIGQPDAGPVSGSREGVVDGTVPNERSNLGALQEAQATVPKSGFDKMYNVFGPSVKKKEDPIADLGDPADAQDNTPNIVVLHREYCNLVSCSLWCVLIWTRCLCN